MGNCILHNETLQPLWMRQGHAKTDRPAVVLHIERVMRQLKRLREAVHYSGEVVECVRELFWIRPIAVPESGIVGRYQMVLVREPR
jgi:hypothetical protein